MHAPHNAPVTVRPSETPVARHEPQEGPALLGVDFSSAPSRKKPITVAHGRLSAGVVRLLRIDELPSLEAFEALLATPGPWFGAFDFPFGLPRTFVQELRLGEDADTVIASLRQRCGTRMGLRSTIDAWSGARPAGQRLVHRRTDLAMAQVRSTSPLQTRYVPVGFMYFEGLWRLVQAGLTLPRLRRGDPSRVAVEAYPALLAHELIGPRSYKNAADDGRLIARKDLLGGLELGRTRLGLRVAMTAAWRDRILDDASGDRLDALLCLVQAAWSASQPDGGLPQGVDPVEGWIVTAGFRPPGG